MALKETLEATFGGTRLILLRGDIAAQEVDAVVNAANTTLLGGGGVDGAIHRAGGPKILEECKKIRAKQGGCPTGEAVITPGGDLTAKWVIHTVGPVWRGGENDEDRLLASAYRASLAIAAKKRLKSVAFPSISTGAYSFPIDRAAEIALRTVRGFLENDKHSLKEVRFVLFQESDLRVYDVSLARVAR